VTDTLERDLMDAGLGLLRADTGLTSYPDAEGSVPESPAVPYVRVYVTTEWPKDGDANAIDGLSVSATTRWYCNCVGETEYAAAAIAMRVRTQLLNARPTVTGRNCGLIYMEASEATNRSELGGSPLYVRSVVYAMVSVPG
jgi:hypothetical protein